MSLILQADARHLPLRGGSVDAIISGPPAPRNGIWENDYWGNLEIAKAECLRVLKSDGEAWFILRHSEGEDRWFNFNHRSSGWAHRGHNFWPLMPRPGKYWGVTSPDEVADLVRTYTRSGDLVLDPFCGRGGIPGVVRDLGRRFMAIDIDWEQLRWR